MKTNPNDFINEEPRSRRAENSDRREVFCGGLTKREYFAAKAMVGALVRGRDGYGDIGEVSVKFADALIAELNKGGVK